MKIRAVFDSTEGTIIELTAEQEGEKSMLALLRDGGSAKVELVKDGQRPPYQKITGAKIIIRNAE